MKPWLVFLLSTSLMLFAACKGTANSTPSIQVEDAWARAASQMEMGQGDMSGMGGSTSAAYMLIRNNGEESDRLQKADTTAAQSAEVHESKDTQGVVSMRPVESLEIPAGGSVELRPGGLHVMLIGLTRDLKAGEKINLVLKFENAGELTVQAEVRSP